MKFQPHTPGVYKMTATDYYAAPGIGKHSLDLIAKSPLDFALYRQFGMEATDAMEAGTLLHTAVLEPHLFAESCYLRPETYISEKGEEKSWNGNSNSCKAWMESHTDKPVLKSFDLRQIQNCARSTREHPLVAPLLEDGEAELSMFAECPETGAMRKGRADWITQDANGTTWIVDFKFVTSALAQSFAKQVADLRYYVQASYYMDLLKLLPSSEGYEGEVKFVFVAVEREPMNPKSDIHRVQVYELHSLDVEMGRNHYIRDLRRYQQCLERGEWPSDTDQIKTIELPKWVRMQNAI